MRITLKEIVGDQAEIVWYGDFSPRNKIDENAILDEAFDVALCNYISMLYPEGFGLSFMPCPQHGHNILMRRYHCSGRNVRITYKEDGMELDDRSRKDRDYILEINQNEEIRK